MIRAEPGRCGSPPVTSTGRAAWPQRTPFLGTVVVTLLLGAMSSRSLAAEQPPTQPADSSPVEPTEAAQERDARLRRAKELLDEGVALTQAGDFAGALSRFQRAYGIYPSIKLLVNIGTSLRHLGRNAEAAEAYERYLADPRATPERQAELERILAEIEQQIGRLSITLEPAGARLLIDGRRIDSAGNRRTVRLDPGEHTVVVEQPGFVTAVKTVAVARREHRRLPITLSRRAVSAAAPAVEPNGSAQRVVAYVLGGTGLAGLAAGGIAGGFALATDAEADEHCAAVDPSQCDAEGASLSEDARSLGTLGTVLLVTGGALLAGGVVVWATAPAAADDDVTVALRVRPDATAAITVRW